MSTASGSAFVSRSEPLFAYITVLLGSRFTAQADFCLNGGFDCLSFLPEGYAQFVDYIIFCSHSLVSEHHTDRLDRIIEKLNGTEAVEQTHENST